MQTSSNETTPSDVEDDDDDDVDDVTNNEEHMDETDFSIAKIIMPRNNLDNRKTNVFCCGDTKGGGVLNKLLGVQSNQKKKPNGPGQAVQVVTNEFGVTEILDEDEVVGLLKYSIITFLVNCLAIFSDEIQEIQSS